MIVLMNTFYFLFVFKHFVQFVCCHGSAVCYIWDIFHVGELYTHVWCIVIGI